MSDEAKILDALNAVEAKVSDFAKSSKAELAAQKTELTAELAGVRKQLQEFAELTKTMKAMPKGEREVWAECGKAFLDAHRRTINKAASEGTDADGGYVVADEFATQIKSAQNRYGVARQLYGTLYPMQSDVTKVPVDTFEDTSGNTPEPVAVSENSAMSEGDEAQLDQVTLTAAKKGVLLYVSNELMQDAFVDYLGAYLTPKLGRRMARLEDTIVFTTATTGLLNTSNLQSVTLGADSATAFADVTFDDLMNAEDAVVDDALENGAFIAHRSIINILRKIKGTDGQYVWTPAAGGEPATLNGYSYTKASIFPARTASAKSTGFIMFGDLALGCVIGERGTRQIRTSEDFRFNYDQIAVRMTERFALGTNSNIGRALCVIKTAAE